MTSLYDKLKIALVSARDATLLEAQRQKQHYDHKAGAVELHPGDKVLVKLDSFRGQQWKLKNRWGDALYIVVKRVADGIPAYEVETMWIRRDKCPTMYNCFYGLLNQKASHWGWTTYQLILVSLEQSWQCHSVRVLSWAWYHAGWFMGSTWPCLSLGRSHQLWRWAMTPAGCLRGRPKMEQAIRFPVTSHPARGAFGPWWEMSQHIEQELHNGSLKHNPTGGRKCDSVNVLVGVSDTHIPGLPLTTCYENYTDAGHWNEPFSHFFCPP